MIGFLLALGIFRCGTSPASKSMPSPLSDESKLKKNPESNDAQIHHSDSGMVDNIEKILEPEQNHEIVAERKVPDTQKKLKKRRFWKRKKRIQATVESICEESSVESTVEEKKIETSHSSIYSGSTLSSKQLSGFSNVIIDDFQVKN